MDKLNRPNLEEFADTMISLAQANSDILAVTGDSRGSAKLVKYGEVLPDQIIEVGIAEQNLVGISAGLASTGKKVFAVSPSCFLTARAVEQIKNDVAYSNNPVKLIGISAGVSYGALGSTHHSLHDFAVLLAFNNVDIVVPADNYETREAVKAAVDYPKPIYIRFGKKPMLDLPQSENDFEIGRARILSHGRDATFIASGETVSRAFLAADLLSQEGIECGVISMHTLRPFDEAAVIDAALNSKAIITVEEHSIHGGLGSLCASLLLQRGKCSNFRIVGIPDENTVTGSQAEIFNHYGISPEGLAKTAKQMIRVEVSK